MLDYGWISLAVLYAVALAGLMVYGLHCYLMLALFLRHHRRQRQQSDAEAEAFIAGRADDDWPHVTLQLPVYNERQVVARLIRSAARLDYPRHRFDIQVLDDSTDDTAALIDQTVREVRDELGVSVAVLRRPHRDGFKAGALAHGLKRARGDYLAIFDADFVIPPHFLRRAVALLAPHPEVACVQGRWGHLNREENWLTRAQSVGIDGHFAAEQGARGYTRLCLNFNDTAGLWRRQAIADAGGWQGDTLTEDLDLSYRAQLAGYRLRYDLDLECPAEIPNTIAALKSQQQRWAKGSMETAIKLLPEIFRSRRLSLAQKLEAVLHLTHYAVAVFMCAVCVLTLPVLALVPFERFAWSLGGLWAAIVVSALAPCAMYTGSGLVLGRGRFSLLHWPAMLVVGTGLCLNNANAVFQALLGRRSDFVRTPKSGSRDTASQASVYPVSGDRRLGLVELVFGLYCWLTLIVYVSSDRYFFGLFLAAYALGFTVFGWQTLRTTRPAEPLATPATAPSESGG